MGKPTRRVGLTMANLLTCPRESSDDTLPHELIRVKVTRRRSTSWVGVPALALSESV